MADIIFGSGISIGTGISVTPPPFTIPDAPTIGTATTTGLTTATVAFTQPGNDGGLPITSYTATSSPGGITGTLSQAGSGTINMTGLTQGTSYTFTVTATNSIGTSSPSSASNSITTFAVPVNTVAPVVSGTASFGSTLSTTDGTWTGTATITFTYQWQRAGVNIASATSSTYTLVAADVGNAIRCVVTGTNSYGNSSANSNATSNVSAIVPGAPTIGTATAIGSTTATVTFTQPASDGGSTITSYTATSSPDSITGTLSQAGSGTITVNGLTPSTSYTFTVTATNSVGTGSASSASNSTTTTAPQDSYFEYNTLLIPGASTTFVDDASTNNFAVSIFGDTKPNNFGPYTPGYYSNYFNGSSYLSVASNANLNLSNSSFTIELWVFGTGSNAQGIISKGNTTSLGSEVWSLEYTYGTSNGQIGFGTGAYNSWSAPIVTGTVTLNAWNHVAVVRNGNVHTMYINGVASSSSTASYTVTDAGTLYIGTGSYAPSSRIFNAGYISNARLVIGTAVYTGNFTPSTTPLTAIANTSLLTCQSNRFIDNSTNNFAITVNGNTTISSFDPFVPNTSYSTYGSGYFDGTTDFLKTPSDASLSSTLLASNFTIECWVYVTSLPNAPTIWTNSVSNSDGFSGSYIQTNGTIGTGKYGVNEFNTTNTVKLNTWTHFALVSNSGTLYVYLNGVQDPTTGAASTYLNTSATKPMQIGSSNQSPPAAIQGFISDFRVVASAVYTSAFTPPATPLTAIANTSLLTLQNNQSVNNNVFLDNSTNNSFITRAGNATQGTFSPYGANWSNYLNGSSSLSVNVSGVAAGTSTFTFESWIYLNAYPGTDAAFYDTRSSNGASTTGMQFGVYSTGALKFYDGTETNLGGTVPLNQWVHIAFVRNGSNVMTPYINGTATGTTVSSTRNFSDQYFWICSVPGPTSPYINAYLSNLRWVVGTAVYTSNFTPSTTPLTAITNTKILTCQSNRFIDNSANVFTITINGSPTIQRFSPFSPSAEYSTSTIGGSAYFDGTTSNIITTNTVTTIGTQDFCLEAWVYCFSTTSYACIIGNDTAGPSQGCFIEMGTTRGIWLGGPEVSLGSARYNQWFHVVFCRVSGTYAGFLNGTRQATGAFSFNLSTAMKIGINNYVVGSSSGFGTTGYISDGRVTVGSSPYSPSSSTITVPTAPLTAVQNTVFLANMTSGGAYDAAMMNNLQTVGDAKLSTAVAKFGGSSMLFDGTGDNLYSPTSINYNCGTGNFTVEMWVYISSYPGSYPLIIGNNNGSFSAGAIALTAQNSTSGGANKISVAVYDINSSAVTFAASSTNSFNTWYHVALVRNGTNLSLYRDGISVASTTISSSIVFDWGKNGSLIGGGNWDGANGAFNGYIDDLRVTKGVARYTSTFTPPTQAFPTY